MSERDEPDDKITTLFPEESGAEGNEPDQPPEPEGSDLPEEPGRGEDNVVQVDFDGGGPEESSGGIVDIEQIIDGGVDEIDEAKYEVFRMMIDEGMVMVTLDPGVEGVEVPSNLAEQEELRLNFSHLFYIDDFEYDARGVRASLSFDGVRQFCDIPWTAVQMLYCHETGDVVVFESTEFS